MEYRGLLRRLKALLLVSKEAISCRKIPFSRVINDPFQCAHLSAACPPELSRACLNKERGAERETLTKLHLERRHPPPKL